MISIIILLCRMVEKSKLCLYMTLAYSITSITCAVERLIGNNEIKIIGKANIITHNIKIHLISMKRMITRLTPIKMSSYFIIYGTYLSD